MGMGYIRELVAIFLHLDEHLGRLIQLYGQFTYGILFLVIFCETGLVVTPFLPGDSLLFVVGAFAGAGYFHFVFMGVLLTLAAVIGDGLNYYLGKKLGPTIFSKGSRVLRPEYLEKTQKFYEKHGNATIILARFVPSV